jgi:hypothetical protein
MGATDMGVGGMGSSSYIGAPGTSATFSLNISGVDWEPEDRPTDYAFDKFFVPGG